MDEVMDRNSLLDKIRALLSKTTENGCTESEMLSALDKARAMMDAYEISDDELQLTKNESAILHAEAPDASDPHKLKWRLSDGIGQFCNVQIFRHTHETGLKAVGMPSDVQFAMWLLDHLADFVFHELYKHLIGCLAPKSERRTIIRSFVDACCTRVAERMIELAERSKAARTSNGRELIVIKGAAIKAYMKAHDINIQFTCIGGRTETFNEAARAAGHAAGERATFGRPVTGASGVLRIGK